LEYENLHSKYNGTVQEHSEEQKLFEQKLGKLKLDLERETATSEQYQSDNQNLVTSTNNLRTELEQTKSHVEEEKKIFQKRIDQLAAELAEKTQLVVNLQNENLKILKEQEENSRLFEHTKMELTREKKQIEERNKQQVSDELEKSQEQLSQFQQNKQRIIELNQNLTSQLQQEKRPLTEQFQKFQSEISDLKDQNSMLKLENQQITISKEKYQKELEEVTISSAKEKIRLESEISHFKSELNEKTEALSQQQLFNQSQGEELRVWKKKFNDLVAKFEEANPTLKPENFAERLKQLESEVSEKSQLIYKLELENQRLSDSKKSNSEELYSINNKFSEEKLVLEKTVQDLKVEKTEIASRFETKVKQLEILEKNKTTEIEDLKQIITQEKKHSAELYTKWQNEVTQSSTRITELEFELSNIKHIHDQDLLKREDEYENQKKQLEEELFKFRSESSNLNQELSTQRLINAQFVNGHKQQFESQEFHFKLEISNLEKKIFNLSNELEEKDREFDNIQHENRNLLAEIKSLKQTGENLTATLEHERKQHQRWKSSCEEVRNKYESILSEERAKYDKKLQDIEQQQVNARGIRNTTPAPSGDSK